MTPKEELIRVIERSSDELVQAILELIKVLQHQQLETLPSLQGPSHRRETYSEKPKYDFSDLVGRLTWQGDAVTVQRVLRDEW